MNEVFNAEGLSSIVGCADRRDHHVWVERVCSGGSLGVRVGNNECRDA